MAVAWRIVQAHLADRAFTGEGSRHYGGRWNSKGFAVVYTSGSISLAILEILVHIPIYDILEEYVHIPVEFDPKLSLALKQYDEILKLQNNSQIYRPTLYDFLAHRAIDFYKVNEQNITKPAL